MQEIINRCTKIGSFEYEFIQKIIIDIRSLIATKDYQNEFIQLAEVYQRFQKEVNEHYQIDFEKTHFEQFDTVVTPILLNQLLAISYERAQRTANPDQQFFTNEQFILSCQKYHNITQSELGIPKKFQQTTMKPYYGSIQILRQLQESKSFTQLMDLVKKLIHSIYSETEQNAPNDPVTGDDMLVILIFVILKTAPKNLLLFVYAFQDHLPAEVMSGEAAYYMTTVQSAIIQICTMTNKENTFQVQDSAMTQRRYTLPEIQLYNDQIASQSNQNRPFVLLEKRKVKGYINYYCVNHLLKNSQLVKVLTVKCGCTDAATCAHDIECGVIRLNGQLSQFQAEWYDWQLRNLFNVNWFIYNEETGILESAPLTTVDRAVPERLLLLEQNNNVGQLQTAQLLNIYVLHYFGCYIQETTPEFQKLVFLDSKSVDIDGCQKIFQKCYNYFFEISQRSQTLVQITDLQFADQQKITVYSLDYLGWYRLLIIFLALTKAQLPSKMEVQDLIQYYSDLHIMNFVDPQEIQVRLFSILRYMPSVRVQQFIKEQYRQLVSRGDRGYVSNSRIQLYSAKLLFSQADIMIYPNDFPQSMTAAVTPFIVQLLAKVFSFLLMCLQICRDQAQAFSIASVDEIHNVVLQISRFQHENCLENSQKFDERTIAKLIECVERHFYASWCSK